MRISLSFFLVLSMPLAAQVGVPKIGTVRYSDGSLHSVQGLPKNMIVCDLPFDSVDAVSFSDHGGLVSQQGVVRLLGPGLAVVAEYKSGELEPLLNIEGDLTTALAWLPSKRLLLRWDGDKFSELAIAASDLEGTVTNLQAMGSKQARLLVKGADGSVSGLIFSTRNGSLVSSEPLAGVRGYAFSQNFFFLFADQNQLVADNLRGYRRSVDLPAPDLRIERMSNQWLHLYSPSLKQDWALHLTQADIELSILPAVASSKLAPAVASARTSKAGEAK